MGKVLNLNQLKKVLEKERAKGKKVVFTNGCFDLLHLGHIRCLKKAKKKGDILIVGLNSDSSVKKLKGSNRPLVPQAERAEILASLSCVDYVIVFPDEKPIKLIWEIKPDIHVKGGDYKGKVLPEEKVVKSYGGKVILIKEEKGYSTTKLIERIIKTH